METADQLGAMILDRRDHQTPYIATSLVGSINYQDLNLANKPRVQTIRRPSLLLKTKKKHTKITNKIRSVYDTKLLHLHTNMPKQNENLLTLEKP